jgi:hypothetical protein
MDLAALRAELRSMLDDEAEPHLWPSDSLDRYINAAHAEAVQRARLFRVDESMPVTAGQPVSFEVDAEVWGIESVVRDSDGRRLIGTSAATLNERQPGWRTRTGHPSHFVFDLSQPRDKRLLLNRAPVESGTYTVTTLRHPAVMEDDSDEPEAISDTKTQLLMLHYAAMLALITRDADKQAPAERARHEELFTAAFGPPLTEAQRASWEQRGDMTIRPEF